MNENDYLLIILKLHVYEKFMFLKKIPLYVLLFICLSTFSQNMKEGFLLLEHGKYKDAETYFKKTLETYPTNKTARLCYGRAVGLNGNPIKAKTLFLQLLKDYANDFEIKLNYGESLLWNKNYNEAKVYYEKLISQNKKSFPALLGYANTLSNLKDYENAIAYITKALIISPNNKSALTSKKYMYLGHAYQQEQLQNYEIAETILKENLNAFPNDKETLFNLSNLYLISNQLEKAEATYNKLLENEQSKLGALNGLSLIAHLRGKESKALHLSTKAYNLLSKNEATKTKQQTTERFIQALIWNHKYKKAQHLIDELLKKHPNENWILSLRATLNIYKSDFKNSVTDYTTILKKDSTSFDGNLGKANALKALGKYAKAYTSAQNTLAYHKNQKDAVSFIKKLDKSFTPSADSKLSYSFDNGDNEAYSFSTNLKIPLSTKFKILGNYNYRTTKNTVNSKEATTNSFLVGISYDLLSNINFTGSLGISSSSGNSSNYNQFLTDIYFYLKPFKLQDLKIGYKKELQNFNADLINRKITQDNIYIDYSLNTNFNLGFFSQYYYTNQNDNNTRNLFFTSLYYTLLKKPSLKVGVNYQNISFKNQVPTTYFSPEKFNAYEVFVNLIRDEIVINNNEWFYELTAATGLQFIEEGSKQNTYRIQAILGYQLSHRSLFNFYASQSNVASATAAGFRFTEIGIRFKWLLLKKPLFKK